MTDLEICEKASKVNITEIAKKLNIENNIVLYGNDKAKINMETKEKKGKLILVTSINPTPFGEGKTTLAIGILDALCKLGKNAVAALREPSLGPVFGTKGGATGGGMSQVIPMEDINLHFTGDLHAITSANNLLCAVVDSHIFNGNELNIDKDNIMIRRCLDINDRALRNIYLNKIDRNDKFDITTASEMMAILCLSKNLDDLKEKVGNILIGYSKDGKEIFARDLKVEGSVAVLLKDAIKPNLVQTLEHNPVIIHGGPFANIAHGCNSIIATNLALSLSDYVITEAGFGSDMGAMKFFDIKCRYDDIYPDLVVLGVTIKALKHNGKSLEEGIENLKFHIENMNCFSNNLLIVLNKFEDDTEEEINFVKEFAEKLNTPFLISDAYKKGGSGALAIASYIVSSNKESEKHFMYDLDDDIYTKIEKVCINHYHAKEVLYEEKSKKILDKIKTNNFNKLPICIAKTPSSITDDPKKLGYPKDFTMTVTDVKINNGAGFITIYMGNIMTMPGLSKSANYLNIDINDGKIVGLF